MPLSLANGWTGGPYSLFRAVLGLYLCVHFTQLAPWAAELFSDQGMLPDASVSPLARLFPNVLAWCDSAAFATWLVSAAAVASVLLAVGFHDRAAALLVWYVWACLLGRNPLIANPSIPFVGWILLAHSCLPPSPYGLEPAGRGGTAASWRMDPRIFAAAWTLMALGYSFSGYTKLASPSWIDGTALARVLENPLARPGTLREVVLALPDPALKALSWTALGLELLFAPLALVPRLRPWLWGLLLGMHVSLLLLVDFADLSLGMVMLHLFTLDPAWIRSGWIHDARSRKLRGPAIRGWPEPRRTL
jgi:hypothetical protein